MSDRAWQFRQNNWTSWDVLNGLREFNVTSLPSQIPIIHIYKGKSRSLWPCGIRRRSAAARLLKSRFRNLLRAWVFVCRVVCCVGNGHCDSWSLVQRSPTAARVCVIVCDLETSTMRMPMPKLGCCVREKYLKCSSRPWRHKGREGEALLILNPGLYTELEGGVILWPHSSRGNDHLK